MGSAKPRQSNRYVKVILTSASLKKKLSDFLNNIYVNKSNFENIFIIISNDKIVVRLKMLNSQERDTTSTQIYHSE